MLFLGGVVLAVVTAVARRRARRLLPAAAVPVQGASPPPATMPVTAGGPAGPGEGHPAGRRYLLKQRLASLGGALTISDELGRPCFTVQGRLLGAGDRLSFRDLEGHELAVVEQRLQLGQPPCYEIRRQGRLVATVRQTGMVGQRFQIDLDSAGSLQASGDILGNEYAFSRDGRTVATATRRWTVGDTYQVEVAAGEDDVLLLALMVAVERSHHAES